VTHGGNVFNIRQGTDLVSLQYSRLLRVLYEP
jgi:hypothetical protein